MWEQIRSNRIRSVVLVIGMGLLLLLLGWFIGAAFIDSPTAGLVIALIIWGILNLVAYFQGDSILLSVSKARKTGPDDAPKLYNVVEEMKIASGLPKMPDVYIIDDPAMNAFATGRDENHASVAITSGLLEKLNRDELQGVIGHEMSHIKNRDVLLMSLCSVMLGTIVMLAWFFSRVMFFGGGAGTRRGGSRDSGGGVVQLIILAIGIILIILAPIFAQLIYFAVSRRREYLADASSALYTRYPEGLASALEKLSNSTAEVKAANQATAPMYIVNPFRKKFSVDEWTSTHPPIGERIRILRGMAGGASLAEYERAYSQMHKGSAIIPASALAGASAVGFRAALPQETVEPTNVERVRETSDMLWKLNKYKLVTCACGTKLKLPPEYKEPSIKCPHCGRVNQV